MRITLNGGDLDCSLQEEKTVGEVLVSLDEWLESQGLIMTGLSLDGEDRSQDIEALRGVPIQGSSRLDIQARNSGAWRADALSRAIEWLGKAAADPESPDLLGSAEGLLGGSAGLLDAEELSLLDFSISKLRAGAAKESIAAELGKARDILTGKLSEIQDPSGAMKKLAAEYLDGRERFSSIPVLMQTSRDREAMDGLGRFTALFSTVIRIIPLLPSAGIALPSGFGGEERGKFFSDLNAALRELAQAFKDRDTVLIGDLCEYEVLPRMDALFKGIAELLEQGGRT